MINNYIYLLIGITTLLFILIKIRTYNILKQNDFYNFLKKLKWGKTIINKDLSPNLFYNIQAQIIVNQKVDWYSIIVKQEIQKRSFIAMLLESIGEFKYAKLTKDKKTLLALRIIFKKLNISIKEKQEGNIDFLFPQNLFIFLKKEHGKWPNYYRIFIK